MAEKPDENPKLENVGDARPAGTNLGLCEDGEIHVTGKEPTEDSNKAGNPSSSESEVPTTGSLETPESGAAVGAFGDGGDGASNPQPHDDLGSSDPISSESSSGQPHGNERIDMVPSAFVEKGYGVHIHGGSAHFTTQDGSCCVEMENGKEFHIELSNNNDYRCDVDIQMATHNSGMLFQDVGGWRLDAGQEKFPIHNSGYGQGKFVFYSSDPGRKEGETNEKNKENLKSIFEIKFVPEAYSIYFKMKGDKSVTNIRFLKKSETPLQFADVLKKWVEKKNMAKDEDYSQWCFSDGHEIIKQQIRISAFADKQSIKQPLMLFKNKEKISLKLNNGDKKEIEVCPIDFHYLEFKQIVPELFGEGELYEYEVKLKDKAISKENYLECFQVDAVDVIKKPKARAVDPTTEGSNRGFRGIGLTRGLGFSNEGEIGGFRGVGYRGGGDFEEEQEEAVLEVHGFRDISNIGVIRYEGEPVQAFQTVASDGNFYTIPEHQVVFTIHLVRA